VTRLLGLTRAGRSAYQFGQRYLYKWWKKACKNLKIDGIDLYGVRNYLFHKFRDLPSEGSILLKDIVDNLIPFLCEMLHCFCKPGPGILEELIENHTTKSQNEYDGKNSILRKLNIWDKFITKIKQIVR